MDNGGRIRKIKGILYRLKRTWGQPLSLCYLTSSTTDLATGVKQVTRSALQIKRAILLPTSAHKAFKYDIGYLRANSNFTYGSLWTDASRRMIVDRTDLPADFTIAITDNQYVVYDHKRYSLKEVEDIEDFAVMVTMEFTGGEVTNEVHEVLAYDHLMYTESFVGGPA